MTLGFFLLTFHHSFQSFSVPGNLLLDADAVSEKLQELQVILSFPSRDSVPALC